MERQVWQTRRATDWRTEFLGWFTISEESANHMDDEQWLGAIAKYGSKDRIFSHEHPEKGGAEELSLMLRKFAKKQPDGSLCWPRDSRTALIQIISQVYSGASKMLLFFQT